MLIAAAAVVACAVGILACLMARRLWRGRRKARVRSWRRQVDVVSSTPDFGASVARPEEQVKPVPQMQMQELRPDAPPA